MIDSHCHLDFCDDPAAAADPTLLALVSVGTDPQRNRRTLTLADSIPNVWAAVGIHPNSASLSRSGDVREDVAESARHERVVAIGETGFDDHWRDETLEAQREAFDWHVELAGELDLPVILHVRDRQGGDDASVAASRALREAGYRKGVLHCFNGNRQLLDTALELGWMISFAGNLTYPSARLLQEAAPQIPADRLLVETDSPYLAPVPHRGRRNRPENVRHTARFLAELRGSDAEELELTLDQNAVGFYQLPLQAGD